VTNYEFTPDSKSMVYWSNQRLLTTYELFKYNLDSKLVSQLEFSPTPNSNNSVNSKIQFSGDGSKVIFTDNPLTATGQNNETLNSYSLLDRTLITLSPATPNYALYHYFEVSKAQNKVAFFFGAIPDLYISNLDGTGLALANISYPTTGWKVAADFADDPIRWSGASHFVIVKSLRNSGSGAMDTLYSAIATDGSGLVISMPINWLWVSSNSTGNVVLLASHDLSPAYKLMDLNTGHQLDLSNIEPKYFSKDGAALIATETSASGQSLVVSIDVISGAKTSICPQAASSISNVQDLEAGKWLITAWNATSGILNIYQQTAGQCSLKNSIPVSQPTINNVILTPDSQKAIVSVTINLNGKNHDELFYVPLNGKMAYQINSPVFTGAKLGNVQALPDSQSVLYTGDQLKSGETGAFLWKAP